MQHIKSNHCVYRNTQDMYDACGEYGGGRGMGGVAVAGVKIQS